MENTRITVKATINAPLALVWEKWTSPEAITQWNHASDDWHTPRATNDLREGGKFVYRMEAKDGSFGFDFEGTYTRIIPQMAIDYLIADGRPVHITFTTSNGHTIISETFGAENENPVELQRMGWQAILDNFRKYVEGAPS